MRKNHLLATAIAILTMVSCSSNDYVGDKSALENTIGDKAISFGFDVPMPTRASGLEAATTLGGNFVVFGYKTVGGNTQTVFDNYQLNYLVNTSEKTTTNSAGWEYVGYKNLPDGTTTSVGTLNTDGVAKNANNATDNIVQSIKYWDFSASQYAFFAYSLGAGETDDGDEDTNPQYAKASALSNSTYTLEGNAAQLGACYISDKKTLTSLSSTATQVDLEFRSFLSKIQLGFYETIPGYSVKDVKFYPSATGSSTTTPSLYASSELLPNGGKYTVTFDANGMAQVALASDPVPTKIAKIDFSPTLTNYADKEYKEKEAEEAEEAIYLGRTSNAATKSDIINVLPNPANENALNLKMDFTLVSRDGTDETIKLKGATAVVPAAYAQWRPNFKYTYIFKITDNTNAQSGAVTGLYPITLDAVVTDAQDGSIETTTTVTDPSITTYAKASDVLADNEYKKGANIYIVVGAGTELTGENAKLYTATIDAGAAQEITEVTVANALKNGTESPTGTWTVTDALGKKLVVTSATGLTAITKIPAADAPHGNEITVNGATFTPTAAGYYVFEYIESGVKYYKVIKVVE